MAGRPLGFERLEQLVVGCSEHLDNCSCAAAADSTIHWRQHPNAGWPWTLRVGCASCDWISAMRQAAAPESPTGGAGCARAGSLLPGSGQCEI